MNTSTADLGTNVGLTQPTPAGFDARAVRLALAEQMYRALKLANCWCTEKVWHTTLPAAQCSRCKAIAAYEATL